jgi:shikimate kinase
MPPRCVLVGPPGAGKSSVGQAVAHRLGVAHRDTDDEVATAAGKSVADIFIDDGEERFRELERVAVAAALARDGDVVSVGGGAVLDDRTRVDLRGHRVIHLRVSLHDATRRVGWGPGRPLLVDNPRARLRELMVAREPLYAEVATDVVDTTDRSVDEVVSDVVELLGGPTR